jgi:hypothetical protein
MLMGFWGSGAWGRGANTHTQLRLAFDHAFSLVVHNVHVSPGPISAVHCTAEVPRTTQTGSLVFPLYAADRFGNSLQSGDDVVAVVFTGAMHQTADSIQWTPPHYLVSTLIRTAGEYRVSLRVGAALVQADGQTTYAMTVAAGPTHPPACVVAGLPEDGVVVAGAPLVLTLAAVDVFGNRREDTAEVARWSYVVLGEGEAAEGIFSPVSPGLYSATLTPRTATVPGRSSLSLTVTLRGEAIFFDDTLRIQAGAAAANNTAVRALPSPTTPASHITDKGATGTAGAPFQVSLRPRDVAGNAVRAPLGINASVVAFTAGVNGFFFTARPESVTVDDNGNANADGADATVSSYTAAFTITSAGLYSLSAAADGVTFFDPQDNLIIVAALPEPAHTVLVLRTSYEASTAGELTLALADAWHNVVQRRHAPTQLHMLNAPASRPAAFATLVLTETAFKRGVYTLAFTPPHVGVCMLVYSFADGTALVQVV